MAAMRTLTAIAALNAMGYDTRRPVRARVLVRQGAIKTKRYTCRLRISDGHVLFRWGRLLGAKEVLPGIFVFFSEEHPND